ncbi:increased DNA methylation 1-like isoform X2 [Mercurialis annua]|uniref:increased DNA methylation 1-like isoform X2 n=1 Tax=Mercurialis annua TaxID=3986 RepID=UPI00215FBDFC|nr:increased DNA methylation 1-like isoform X2 [Mercurialis annua]
MKPQKLSSMEDDLVYIESEYCPEAITEWFQVGLFQDRAKILKTNRKGVVGIMTLRAKKHLSALGWTFKFVNHCGRRELRYISPRGKQYNSLRVACKEVISKTDNPDTKSAERTSFSRKEVSCLVRQEPRSDSDKMLSKTKKIRKIRDFDGPDTKIAKQIIVSEKEPSGGTSLLRKEVSCLVHQEPRSDFDKLLSKTTKIRKTRGFNNPDTKAAKRIIVGKKEQSDTSFLGKEEVSCIVYQEPRSDSEKLLSKTTSKRQIRGFDRKTAKQIIDGQPEQSGRISCFVHQEPVSESEKFWRKTRGFIKRVQHQNGVTAISSCRTILTWLVDNNVLSVRENVYYYGRLDMPAMAKGCISGGGIKCNCCGKVYTLNGFEFHVTGKYYKPAANIFLEDGRSLLQCQMKLIHDDDDDDSPERLMSRNRNENDDVCSVCHYGGDLILCDQCPSSFHQKCLGLMDVPDGDWFCPSCCCGICHQNKLKPEDEHSVYNNNYNGVMNCAQCETKYHIGCLTNGSAEVSSEKSTEENWFCSKKCDQIFAGLHELLGRPISVGMNNLTWTLLKANNHKPDDSEIDNYSKLKIALDMVHECFEPVQEPYTKGDILKNVIFSKKSDLHRLNFRGFYTVLLQKDDEFITVATVRVYGDKVAEIPLVATRIQYRRHGMCGILMNVLEKKLKELGVQRMILPAVRSVLNTWTGSFGFSKLTEAERLQLVKYPFLDFQDTVMCHKLLMEAEPVLCIDASGNGDNTELGVLCAVSEVFQAREIGSEIAKCQELEFSAIHTSNSNGGAALIDPGTDPGEAGLDCTTAYLEKVFKCYKRRKTKMIACGS